MSCHRLFIWLALHHRDKLRLVHLKILVVAGRRNHTAYFSRMRSTLSHCDMSDRMTLSPTCKPDRISTVLTELRPSFTFTRSASLSSGITLNRLIVASVWPCTGRPTYKTSFRFSSVIV